MRFNQIDLLLLLLLPLLWNSLVFYLRYSQFSLDLYSCKLSLHEILPTCYLNLFKSTSLKSTVPTLLLSPYFSVDHNTIISSPSSQFQPLHFQPFISKYVKIFPLLTLLDFLYLPIKKLSSAHSWRLLNTAYISLHTKMCPQLLFKTDNSWQRVAHIWIATLSCSPKLGGHTLPTGSGCCSLLTPSSIWKLFWDRGEYLRTKPC